MPNDILELLRDAAQAGRVVRISRGADDAFNCFVVAANELLTMVAYVEDFHVDGFGVFLTESIVNLRHSEIEVFCEKVLRSEQRVLREMQNVPIESWEDVFDYLIRTETAVSVDDELTGSGLFSLGRLVETGDQSEVAIHAIDPRGFWEERTTHIAKRLITLVNFGKEYIEMYAKYASGGTRTPDPEE